MMGKISTFVLAVFFQVVFSQQQQQQQQQQPFDFVGSGMTAAQMWNPSTWSTPYFAAASQAWTDYLKKTQEASSQLYKQWDMTGAGNLYNAGMGYAQQASSQAQQGAQLAYDKPQKGAQMAMDQAEQGAKAAAAQAQQGFQLAQHGAQAAVNQAQQFLPTA